jgi:hypothetical protein
MAPHDARCAARRVEQDRVERTAVPPARRLRRIGGERPRLQTRRPSVSFDAAQPVGVAVERENIEVAELEQVRRLPAGRRAGVEDAGAGREVRRQQRCRELGREVLDRDIAVGEAGQLADTAGPFETYRLAADRLGRHALPAQPLDIAAASLRRALTRNVIGGRRLSASRIDAPASPQSACRRSTHQSGWLWRATGSAWTASTSAARSRRNRRSTAFAKAALCGARRRIACTAWSTRV